jgi:alpha-mannosidase
MGELEFSYRLRPFSGKLQRAVLEEDAHVVNDVPATTLESRRSAADDSGFAGDSIDAGMPEGMIMPVLKRADDGEGWIARLYDASGFGSEGTVHIPLFGVTHPVSLGPHELATIRIGESGACTPVSLIENAVQER